MAITISGNGIDMGGNPVSNASQIDSTVINENGENVRTESDSYSKTEVDSKIVGFKNYIINGNFDVWQRGTSFSGLTNGSYSADRWVVYDTVNDINYNVIRNTGVFQGGYGAAYTWNSGTGGRSIMQFIENVTKFKVGTQVTISFEAYTDSTPYTIDVVIQGVKGVWTASTTESVSNITLTNIKTRYSVTLTVPDWTTLGIDYAHLEDTKLACKFTLPHTTNGKNFIISKVQLEEGSVATPFEHRPYGLELSLCQRYLPAFSGAKGVGNVLNSNGNSTATDKRYSVDLKFPVETRVPPTGYVISNISHFSIGEGTTIIDTAVSSSFNTANIYFCSLSVNGSSTTVGKEGRPSRLITNNTNALIYFTGCEL